MRIVAGKWRGRSIDVPRGDAVRPTADRVREAWMSVISTHLPGARVLDLFAGTGALGLEALSRGAAQVEFVELAPRHVALIRANADALGAGDAAVMRKGDALAFVQTLNAHAYDVAFADPPYRQGLAAGVAERWLAVPFATLLGVEHESREAMPEGGRTRRYGSTAVTLYHAAAESPRAGRSVPSTRFRPPAST